MGGELYVGRDVDSHYNTLFFEAARERGMELRDFNSQFEAGMPHKSISVLSRFQICAYDVTYFAKGTGQLTSLSRVEMFGERTMLSSCLSLVVRILASTATPKPPR